ncbi:hypothetical protein Q0P57_14120, partial [Staphylococcus aureus]|nr:hypothetical protein [Staphylococcus aureus]
YFEPSFGSSFQSSCSIAAWLAEACSFNPAYRWNGKEQKLQKQVPLQRLLYRWFKEAHLHPLKINHENEALTIRHKPLATT